MVRPAAREGVRRVYPVMGDENHRVMAVLVPAIHVNTALAECAATVSAGAGEAAAGRKWADLRRVEPVRREPPCCHGGVHVDGRETPGSQSGGGHDGWRATDGTQEAVRRRRTPLPGKF